MEEQTVQAQFITNLMNEIGVLKSDCIYKDVLIQNLQQEIETLMEALAETTAQLEALKQVETYTMEDEEDIDDVDIDTCFVCD